MRCSKRKRISAILLAFSFGLGLFAQEADIEGFDDGVEQKAPAKKEADDETPGFVQFFVDEVPRYQGLAVGGAFTNMFAFGDWADFAVMNFGFGGLVEFNLPFILPKNLDVGISGHLDWAHNVPKTDSTLNYCEDFKLTGGVYLRVPFMLGSQAFALQPEIGGGTVLHNAKGKNGSYAKGAYLDGVFQAALGLRYILPVKALEEFEFELAPIYTYSPEKNNFSISNVGYRISAVWHIQSFVKQLVVEHKAKKKAEFEEQQRIERERQEEEARLQREEEERKRQEIERLRKEAEEKAAADEAERQRLEEELRAAEEAARAAEEARKAAEEEAARLAEEARLRAEEEERIRAAEEARRAEIAAWPNPELTFTTDGKKFTPDGDGLNDKVIFHQSIKYIEEDIEFWTLSINDPQGNPFRTIKGSGAIPEEIEWDGLSDKGETVSSKNTYKASLNIIPSRTDRLRTGVKTLDGEINVETGLLLQVIVPEHEWKMVVNTMQFSGGGSNFDKLAPEKLKENNETLDEVAEQIKERPGANVIVEGYANNVSGSKREHEQDLIPLSQARAEFIVEELVKRGIDRECLTAEGKGGLNPIASRRDRKNWWKNRRIEFVIRK